MTYANIPPSIRQTVQLVIDDAFGIKATFSASYATADRRDDAINKLNRIAERARLACVEMQSERVAERASL